MFYWIVRAIFIVIIRSLFRLKAEGLNNLPQKSNFIIVANHTSFLDPLVVMVAVPRKIYCIAMRGLYSIFWLKWFMHKMGVLSTGTASEKAVSLLMENKIVGLFPEGGCSRDGNLREFRRGAALLAFKTGRPIVPCAILGTYEAFPRRAKFPKFFLPLKVKIGRPIFLLKEFEEVIDEIFLQEGIFRVRNAIQEMMINDK